MAAPILRDIEREAYSPAQVIPALPSGEKPLPVTIAESADVLGFDFEHDALDRFTSEPLFDLPAKNPTISAVAALPANIQANRDRVGWTAPAASGVIVAPVLRNDVTFSPFRLNVYKRQGSAVLSRDGASLRPEEMAGIVGTYVITLDATKLPSFPYLQSDQPIPFKAAEKRMILEKVSVDPATKKIRLQIKIVENLLPLILVIGAGLAALGVAGFGVADAIESVDKVIVDTSSAWWKWGLIVLIVVVGWWFLKKRPVALGG